MSIESVMPSNHLILHHPLLLLSSIFPSIRVFSNDKDLEEIKKSQSIMNNAINEIENTLERTNSRITEAENRISEVDRKSTRLNSSHSGQSRMPSSA